MNQETIQTRILEMLQKATGETYAPDQDLMGEGCLSSLELMELLVNAEQEFHVKIPTRMLRFVATAADLAQLICEMAGKS